MFQIDDINKAIAKKTSADLKLVEKVNNYYYKEVIKALNNYTASEIKLTYLTTFKARFSPVKRRIWMLIKVLRKLKKKEPSPGIISEIKNNTEELRVLWKIKNKFSVKTYNKINNGKSRKN